MVMKKILPLLIIVACTSQQATLPETTTTTTTINETEEKKVVSKLNKYISHCSTRSQYGKGYSCSNLYDGEFSTLHWQDNGENCKDGYIIFTFAEPVQIKFIVFQNLEQDREFMRNWKAREILYSTPGPDNFYTFELENTNTAQWISMEDVVTTEFTIQILSAYPSESSKDGAPGFPECAIQEIEFFGYIANPSQALDLVNSLKDTKTQEQKNKEMEIGAEMFRNNWINNIIKTYPLLTNYESTISSAAIHWDTTFIIDGEFQCSRKSGMIYDGFINEDYPLTPSFDISEQQSYTCEDGINIIGKPFLQDEQWWVFREVQSYNQEGNCFNKIDINEPCPFDIELPKEILEGNYSLTMPYFHLAERYPVQGIEIPNYVWFCEPDPYVRECQYEYNPTTISLWEYSKFWISTWRTISQWEYQTRWNMAHSLQEEYPQELIEIFNSPAFSIRVDDLTYDCYVHAVHNSNYLQTGGIYPQPLETVVGRNDFLVFPTLYWDCVDDIKDLGFESPSQTGAEIFYQGQGPPVLRGDLGNVDPKPINGSWVMWGPKAPYKYGYFAAFEFEIVEFYWWYEYEDGFFSIDELCEGGRDTFTYEEDYNAICLGQTREIGETP